MAKAKALSPTMIDCIGMMEEAGGEIVRFQGGFWAPRNIARHTHSGIPVSYHGASTVQGLVDRGYATYTEHREGRGGRFPIRATLQPPGGAL